MRPLTPEVRRRIPADHWSSSSLSLLAPVLFALILLAVSPDPARAIALTWDGGGDGTSWLDAANWSPDQVPTQFDDVEIGVGATVVLEASADVSYQVASLNGEGDLTITQATGVTNAALAVNALSLFSGSITVDGGMSLILLDIQLSAGDVFIEAGTITLSGSNAELLIVGSLDAAPGGLFPAAAIDGDGTLTLGATSTSEIDDIAISEGVTVENQGDVTTRFGYALGANFVNTGTWTIAPALTSISITSANNAADPPITISNFGLIEFLGDGSTVRFGRLDIDNYGEIHVGDVNGAQRITVTTVSGPGSASVRPSLHSRSGSSLVVNAGSVWDGAGFRGDLEVPATEFIGYGTVLDSLATVTVRGSLILGGTLFREGCDVATFIPGSIELVAVSNTLLGYSTFEGTQSPPDFTLSSGLRVDGDGAQLTLGNVTVFDGTTGDLYGPFDPSQRATLLITESFDTAQSTTSRDVFIRERLDVVVGDGVQPATMDMRWDLRFAPGASLTLSAGSTMSMDPNVAGVLLGGNSDVTPGPTMSIEQGATLEFVGAGTEVYMSLFDVTVNGTVSVKNGATVGSTFGSGSGSIRATFDFQPFSRLEIVDGTFDATGFGQRLPGPDGNDYGVIHREDSFLDISSQGTYGASSSAFLDRVNYVFGTDPSPVLIFEETGGQRALVVGDVTFPSIVHAGIVKVDGTLRVGTMTGASGGWEFQGVVGRSPASRVIVEESIADANTSFGRTTTLRDDITLQIGDGTNPAQGTLTRLINLLTGASLVVEEDATLTVGTAPNNAFDLSGQAGGPYPFDIFGTLVVAPDPGATLTSRQVRLDNVLVDHQGTVDVQSGELVLGGSTEWSGGATSVVNVAGGATFDGRPFGQAVFPVGSVMNAPNATVAVRSGSARGSWNVETLVVGNGDFTFDLSSPVVAVTNLDVQGDLRIPDATKSLVVNGRLRFQSGEIFGPGELRAAGFGGVNHSTTASIREGLTFSVSGAININVSSNFQLREGSSFHILPDGFVRLRGASTRFTTDFSGAVETVLNEGTLEIATTSTKPLFGPIDFDTPGTLVVGSLGLNLGSVNSLAQFDVGTGALTGGTWILTGEVDGLPGNLLDNQADLRLLDPGARFTGRLGSWTRNSGSLSIARSLNFSYTEPFVNDGEMFVLEAGHQITPALTNNGVFHLPPDSLYTVVGEYAQSTAGRLVAQVDPAGTYGAIAAGTASLAGAVQIDFDSNPEVGDEFELLTYASATGDFTDESGLPATGPLGFPDLEWVTEVAPTRYLARIQGFYNAVSIDLSGSALQRVDPVGGLDDALGAISLSTTPTAARLAATSNGAALIALLDDGVSQSVAAIDGLAGSVVLESTPAREIAGIAIPPSDTGFSVVGGGSSITTFGSITVSVVDGVSGRAEILGDLNAGRGTIERPVTLTFPGGVVDPEAELLAYAPDGALYALDNTGSGPRLWLIDLADASATLIGTSDPAVDGVDDMSFLGGRLFAIRSSTGEVYEIDPTDASLIATTNVAAGLAGLAPRACYAVVDGELDVRDVAADVGGQIAITWGDAPSGAVSWAIRRAIDPCALVLGGAVTPPASGLGDPTLIIGFVDESVVDYTTYHYRVDFFDLDGAILDSYFSDPVFAFSNVVISELVWPGVSPRLGRRVGEQIELQNLSSDPIDLTGWRLSNGRESESLTGVVAGNGFLVWTLATISLDPEGDTLTLLPPNSNFQVDTVSFGTEGGAPSVPAGFTISRVPGTTADDPVSESFSLSTETLGSSNLAQAPQLGSSLVINEIGYTGVAGEDYLELFNPLGSTVRLDAFLVTDGVSFTDTLQTPLSLDAGDLVALGASGPIAFAQDLDRTQLYLYRLSAGDPPLLVDQIGWGPGSGDPTPPAPVVPQTALVRVPDGIAVYLGDRGTNWLDCGGGEFLDYGLPTPGLPNIPPDFVPVRVDPAGGGDFTDLATALSSVGAGTAVLLEEGSYDGPVTIPDGVALIGQSERSTQVIVGSPAGQGAATVTIEGSDPTTRIANLTIRSSGNRALDLVNSFATVQSVRFVENVTELDGAAVRIAGGAPRFDGCTFLRNASEGDGGAVLVESGAPVFERSLFYDNAALGAGGAVYVAGGTASIDRSVFDRNATAVGTGCVHVAAGDAVVRTSLLTNTEGGAALVADAGATGSLGCSVVFANGGAVDPATITVSDVVDADPQYCAPGALDFGYPEGSPAAVLSESCGVTVGITGAGCASIATSSPPSAITRTMLEKAVPNPFNPRTRVFFALAERGRVDLTVYDLRGREVTRLIRGQEILAGTHEIVWNGVDDHGRRVSSGVYMVQLRVDGAVHGPALKTTLLK